MMNNNDNTQYNIGDSIIDRQSKRQGSVIDLVEERDSDTGAVTYSAVKIAFPDGQSEWVTSDKVSFLLIEDSM